MAPISDDVDAGELAALKELIQSDGWHRFRAAYGEAWGPEAILARVEASVAGVSLGNQAAVQDVTQHVLTAAKHMRAMMQWPDERIKQLTIGEKKAPHWMGIHRRA